MARPKALDDWPSLVSTSPSGAGKNRSTEFQYRQPSRDRKARARKQTRGPVCAEKRDSRSAGKTAPMAVPVISIETRRHDRQPTPSIPDVSIASNNSASWNPTDQCRESVRHRRRASITRSTPSSDIRASAARSRSILAISHHGSIALKRCPDLPSSRDAHPPAPRCARYRAATKPSPPLFPGPQRTRPRPKTRHHIGRNIGNGTAGILHQFKTDYAQRIAARSASPIAAHVKSRAVVCQTQSDHKLDTSIRL